MSIRIDVWRIFDEVFGERHLQIAICDWLSRIERNEGLFQAEQAGAHGCEARFIRLIVR